MPVYTNVHECIHHYNVYHVHMYVYTAGRTAQMNLVEHWTKKAIHNMPVRQRIFLPDPESTFTYGI